MIERCCSGAQLGMLRRLIECVNVKKKDVRLNQVQRKNDRFYNQ